MKTEEPKVESAQAVRVIVLEDDEVYRAALTTSLAAYGHDVVGSWGTADEALAGVVVVRPEVAIVDLMLPGMSGAEAIRLMRRLLPELKILVLTAFVEKARILECLAAGAEGYLLKGSRLKNIALSVADVRDGHAPVSPEVARHLVDGARQKTPTTAFDLTQREREVLVLLAEGHVYGSIADALGIGTGTVQSHIKNLYRKLEVSSKAEAVSVAMRAGLLSTS
ncbi:MAG: response regulator transcription factor [Deltaproteobacteria bacterium]|nr:response regulator transcription factor [Deltaproteobacteria bacterium]